jgi:hypothetical protein
MGRGSNAFITINCNLGQILIYCKYTIIKILQVSTKYILNLGDAKNYPDKDMLYVQEILKGFGGDVRILYCFFAQVRENWDIKYENYKQGFAKLYFQN